MYLTDNTGISIVLDDEHGGCWNVQPFSNYAISFNLEKRENWKEIKYVTAEKTYFHNTKDDKTKRKGYVVKGDYLTVEKIEGGWAYCSYHGKTVTQGWIKLKDLNIDFDELTSP